MPTIGLHQVGPRLVVCIVPISSTATAVWPDEQRYVDGANLRRRAEFAAGRDAARQAMVALGARAASIAKGAGEEPLFPAALRGSISHTRTHAVAFVGDADVYRSLGVDIDDNKPLGDAAAAGHTWKSEVVRIQRAMGLQDRARAQNFAFSAKEAIFKCQYPLTGDAGIRALQARLIEDEDSVERMRVAGWRVTAATASTLGQIGVLRFELGDATLALAILPAG